MLYFCVYTLAIVVVICAAIWKALKYEYKARTIALCTNHKYQVAYLQSTSY